MEQQALGLLELAQPDEDRPMPDAAAAVAADAAVDEAGALPNGDAHMLDATVDASSAPLGDDIMEEVAMNVKVEAREELMTADLSLAEVPGLKVRCSGLTPASAQEQIVLRESQKHLQRSHLVNSFFCKGIAVYESR